MADELYAGALRGLRGLAILQFHKNVLNKAVAEHKKASVKLDEEVTKLKEHATKLEEGVVELLKDVAKLLKDVAKLEKGIVKLVKDVAKLEEDAVKHKEKATEDQDQDEIAVFEEMLEECKKGIAKLEEESAKFKEESAQTNSHLTVIIAVDRVILQLVGNLQDIARELARGNVVGAHNPTAPLQAWVMRETQGRERGGESFDWHYGKYGNERQEYQKLIANMAHYRGPTSP
ncbi:hypothetical protein GQX73_g1062 [Xylaria multiplex]|uniref:Uncharacterized protein n=1 Tax=Xylaria multiplex TaxID=323545 RepID=A0A7C8J139_9PEZI|nr:hypothetical protein GQX73_g1062 [Xylaria multiplex]